MADQVSLSVSKAQFFGGVVAILGAVGGFGYTMRMDVTENSRQVTSAIEKADEATKRADLAIKKADDAKDAFHRVDVRLTKIETMLEQVVKGFDGRLAKMEAWRDNPTGGVK